MTAERETHEESSATWKVVGASAQGTSHVKTGTPCHDSFGFTRLSEDSLIIAVSDGAGSASHAEVGSAIAVESSLEALERGLTEELPDNEEQWRELVSKAFEKARAAMERKASETEIPLRQYAATLILLALTPEWTVGAMIGDGAAVIVDRSGECISLCPPQKGEYANMTNFLVMPNALERLDIRVLQEPAQHAAVFTDGLLELALNISENKPFRPFFTPLFKFVEHLQDDREAETQLEAFLNSERINARTDDDKSLVIAGRRLPEAPQEQEKEPEQGEEASVSDDSPEKDVENSDAAQDE